MTVGKQGVRRGVGAGHVDDRGYGTGAGAGNTQAVRSAAVRSVASLAQDAGDCEQILNALGLNAWEGMTKGDQT